MPRVELPPAVPPLPDGSRVGGWWHVDEEHPDRIACDLCPRACVLKPGDRAFCFVRENRDGEMVLSTYGRSTGFCIDPIEKKPLNQFYPGTSVLSFGTAGCNLGCKFCQNWSISKSREVERLSENASPAAIAQAAVDLGSRSVAYTYNDPVVWAEYAIDTAKACRVLGVKNVAVTAGYISPAARGPFYEYMDAANVDLKGFTEDFYWHLTSSHLEPVLDTLRWLQRETNVWVEITNLVIPRANDTDDEFRRMCDWILHDLGPEVPVHFTAFHPDFRLTDRGPTPVETLLRAYDIATSAGLRYAYVGNVQSPREQTTFCPGCRRPVIERSGYLIQRYELDRNRCRHCSTTIAGHYDAQPGNWGPRRQPVRIADYQPPSLSLHTLQPMTKPAVQTAPSQTIVQRPEFTPAQDHAILHAGAELLAAAVEERMPRIADPTLGGAAGITVLGAFVTAKRAGQLRSCCGLIGQPLPLADCLVHAAQRTANDDHRFPPITPSELPFLDIDVWILHSAAPVTAVGEARRDIVQIGRHGLTIGRGQQRGLLLPGVAMEHSLDAEGFLRQVCLKAGLPPTAWKDPDTQLGTFEGHEVSAPLTRLLPQAGSTPERGSFSQQELGALAQFCLGNIVATAQGATPSYFAFGVSDGNVNGVVVTLRFDETRFVSTQRLSIRERLPLQSTLFTMAEQLGRAIAANPSLWQGNAPTLELTILTSAAMHGTVAEVDLRGVDPLTRGLLVLERNKSAIIFAPEQDITRSLAEAATAAKIVTPEGAPVYSLLVQTNARRVLSVQVPQAAEGESVRAPGVAGMFYPADAQELAALVDQCLSPQRPAAEAWPAVMVPHAGLIYSGKLAAQTLERVRIPSTVIVIGPKHTNLGVEWSVAPHTAWRIPGATIPADRALAERLAAAIPGLQLDAAAHQNEHAIEVELPFLARLAPGTKVVGIAIGAANWERCQAFAKGLAQVLREMDERPLLVISSDMNHFATDAENRRLDEIALQALETLDPAKLLETVRREQISMCGVLPAVMVMQTLQELGGLTACQRIGYTTSADVTGDTSRVVGYAGMLLR